MPYPIIVNLQGKLCVIVGGGPVAERRALGLLAEGARLRVVAPQVTPALAQLAAQGKIDWERGAYSPSLLSGCLLAIAATDKPDINASVARDAAAASVLACRADRGAGGSFITPAVIRRGDLLIALSTGGNSPTLAAWLKKSLEEEFGAEWAGWARLFGQLRQAIQSIPSEADRLAAVEQILGSQAIKKPLSEGDWVKAEENAARCLSVYRKKAGK